MKIGSSRESKSMRRPPSSVSPYRRRLDKYSYTLTSYRPSQQIFVNLFQLNFQLLAKFYRALN